MMEELKPLTISNSLRSDPSVLLTPSMDKFVFVQPLNQDFLLAQSIYTLIYKHFKVELIKSGTFKLKETKYLCAQEHDGALMVDDWLNYLWSSKRRFNHLLNVESLFKMYLIELFFPLFKQTTKVLIPGKKDRFVMGAYPNLSKNQGLAFHPVDFNELGIANADFKKLFGYINKDLINTLIDFLILHHDNLYMDLKYQVSLYPSIRNKYWNEIKLCFDSKFKTYAHAEAAYYILKL